MPYRGNDMVGRVLSGLLFLIALLLPVGGADALTLPAFSDTSHAALPDHGEKPSALPISPVRDSSGSPCDGCAHPDSCACCLSCGFVLGNLPSIQNAAQPLAAAPLKYLVLSSLPPDGRSSAPDLPPPRHIV
jgi:hypothetical protein